MQLIKAMLSRPCTDVWDLLQAGEKTYERSLCPAMVIVGSGLPELGEEPLDDEVINKIVACQLAPAPDVEPSHLEIPFWHLHACHPFVTHHGLQG